MTEPPPTHLIQHRDRLEREDRRWKRVGFVALVGVAAAALMGQAPGRLADTLANRRSAAERYLSVVPTENMIAEMIQGLAQQIEATEREKFVQLMKQMIRIDWVNRVMQW